LKRRIDDLLAEHFRVLDLIVEGTARAIFGDLQEAARSEIRERAVRTARMMRANAEAIITFMNAPLDFHVE
jgi:hypothetical protein